MPINLTVQIKWTITVKHQLTKLTQEEIETKIESRNSFIFILTIKSGIKYFALKKTIDTDDSLINCFLCLGNEQHQNIQNTKYQKEKEKQTILSFIDEDFNIVILINTKYSS